MATPSNGGAVPAPVPFSYAQAAKGRAAAPPPPPPPPPPAPTSAPSASSAPGPLPKESAGWTDDYSDNQTAVEEHQSNGVPNGAQVKPRLPEKPSPNGHRTDTTNTPSHPSSPHYDSTATTAKEDDVSSLVKTPLDSIWDRKSSSSQTGESLQESARFGESNQDITKEPEREQADAKPMKAAPVPIVNIWQKRAEEAKAKQTANAQPSAGTANDVPARRLSQTVKLNSEASTSTPKTSHESSNGLAAYAQDASLPTNDKARGSKSSRAQKQESAPQKSLPPPPTRDESAWPTPLTAQDEDRRKAQEKEDKTEKERPQSASSKPHGKNEWIHVPIQHSVKYNTPLPQSRGRGGRGGGRGGRGSRGGSLSERASAQAIATSSRDESAAPEPRGRADTDGRRSSIQAPNGSRTSSSSQTASNEKRASANSTNKRQSLQDEALLPTHSKPTQPGQRQVRPAGPEKGNASPESTMLSTGSNGEPALPKPKGNGPGTQVSDQRKSASPQTESSLDGVQQAQVKRPSAQTDDQEDVALVDRGVPPQTESEQANAATKPTRPDPRPGGPNRSFDSQRESWSSLSFRDGRYDRSRGRGGRGNHYTLSHHTTGQSQNTPSLPPIQTNPPYSAKSSSTFQTQYFQQGNQSATDRRSFPSGPRSASIPMDYSYGRYGQNYSSSQQYGVYSPFVNTPYDFNAAALSAVPYTPSMDQSMVINGVAFQLNYYFSLENLLKDVYLRKRMDSQGFVSLNFIANFQRMKDLTTDLELIKYACSQSPEFELRHGADGQMRIRIKEGWDKWVLNMDERDPSAQNEGPPPSEQPKSHASHGFDLHSPSRSPFPDMMSHGVEGNIGPFGLTPSFQPIPVTSPIDDARSAPDISTSQSQPILGNNVLGSPYASTEPASNGVGDYSHEDADSFPNSRIPFLTVAVRPIGSSHARRTSRSETSRTFSNGSISMEELNQAEDTETRSQSQPEEPAEGDHFPKMLNTRKPLPSPSTANTEPSAESVELFWFKGQEARQPLPSNGNTEFYLQLHFKALEERQHAEPGSCPHDLDVLYQFWSHFLIRNFNTTMYNEFRQLAHDDAARGISNVGMQSLTTFYSEALSSQQPIRDRVARHYVSLVKNEDTSKGRHAFEQLRSAWRNGALNMKNRKRISAYVDQELRDELDKVDR